MYKQYSIFGFKHKYLCGVALKPALPSSHTNTAISNINHDFYWSEYPPKTKSSSIQVKYSVKHVQSRSKKGVCPSRSNGARWERTGPAGNVLESWQGARMTSWLFLTHGEPVATSDWFLELPSSDYLRQFCGLCIILFLKLEYLDLFDLVNEVRLAWNDLTFLFLKVMLLKNTHKKNIASVNYRTRCFHLLPLKLKTVTHKTTRGLPQPIQIKWMTGLWSTICHKRRRCFPP